MKITDSEIIKNGEKELMDAITADLDWATIENIFLKEHNLKIEEDIDYKRGDIIVSNNQVAYKLEFEVKVNFSILLNRHGDYVSIAISGDETGLNPEKGVSLADEIAPGTSGIGSENEDKYREVLTEMDTENEYDTGRNESMEGDKTGQGEESTQSEVGDMMEKVAQDQVSATDNG